MERETQEKEFNDIEEKLIKLSESLENKQELNFEWNQKDGLRYVSDESLELAYEMLSNFKISIALEEKKIAINNNIINLCATNYTTNELLQKIRNNKEEFVANSAKFTVGKDLTINSICKDCKFQKCPKQLAGYILYLIDKNQLKEKLEDRKKFREQSSGLNDNDTFSFEWKFGNILRIIPDEMYDFCNAILERGYVYVNRHLEDNKNVVIYNPFSCDDIKLMYGDIERIKGDNNKNHWGFLKRNSENNIRLCNTHSCGAPGCVLAISGILYYLKELGREDFVEQERKYYQEHKEEAEQQLNNMIETQNDERKKILKSH